MQTNVETKSPEKNKHYNKIIIILVVIIAVLLIALASIFIVRTISEKNSEKKYKSMLDTLMSCYMNEDIESYKNLCYPEGLYQLEADYYYDGDTSTIDDEMLDSLKEEKEAIIDTYGSEVNFSIDVTAMEDASSSDISSVKSQMNSWTEQLSADDIEVIGGKRITFDLVVKSTSGKETVSDCYAMILTLKDGVNILWDWSFSDVEWDNYVYYSED
jgi:hypothetical protein